MVNPNSYGIFKAVRKDNGNWVEGYLFKLEPPLQCFKSDPELPPKWYIMTSQPTDWGLPCIPVFNEVDPDTILACAGIGRDGKRLFEGDSVWSPTLGGCGVLLAPRPHAYWQETGDAALDSDILAELQMVSNSDKKE